MLSNANQICPGPGLEQPMYQEIFRYLNPLGLLFLSRTNKPLRLLLMSKNAASFWSSAIERDPDLPPHPKGLSDPQYVALLLTDECSACGGSTHYSVDFFLLTRLCAICRKKKTINLEHVKYFWLVYSSPQLAPPDGGKWKSSGWCLQAEVGFVNRKMKEFQRMGGSPNPDCSLWIRERREAIVVRRRMAQEMSNWIARRRQERERASDRQGSIHQGSIELPHPGPN
ncbi:unnamed protein product [Rhizoctonia solani]|uniref:F-box domain-containing protein n=1 Tax=Rhizoctonia solani TaxID=456999 RepID=A0A8H3GMH4_9AGAM|nr:unnamed protein product [Rhizoctonia solani]